VTVEYLTETNDIWDATATVFLAVFVVSVVWTVFAVFR
jgi:hypothetical protein